MLHESFVNTKKKKYISLILLALYLYVKTFGRDMVYIIVSDVSFHNASNSSPHFWILSWKSLQTNRKTWNFRFRSIEGDYNFGLQNREWQHWRVINHFFPFRILGLALTIHNSNLLSAMQVNHKQLQFSISYASSPSPPLTIFIQIIL